MVTMAEGRGNILIRFCDKEVYCVMEGELDSQTEMIIHFLIGYKDMILCVINEEDEFIGSIAQETFLRQAAAKGQRVIESIDSYESWAGIIKNSVRREFLVFGENMWEEGRRYFRKNKKASMVPVLNEKRQLICFAWQDEEANREIRMLDELMECDTALGFKDLYPNFEEVTVHGCNELAYHFIRYLNRTGVFVNVTDPLWNECSVWKGLNTSRGETLDYKKYTVYGEGRGSCEKIIDQRKSVSPEFECIDRIYEENICRGVIKDADGNLQELVDKLRGRQIGILGTGRNSLDAYDLLLEQGLDICCFISDGTQEQGGMLFGKRILGKEEAIKSIKEIIFVEADSQYSAWGFGGTDYHHYSLGLKRNDRFFLLQDYSVIPNKGMPNILTHMMLQPQTRLILAGELELCSILEQWLGVQKPEWHKRVYYCDIRI